MPKIFVRWNFFQGIQIPGGKFFEQVHPDDGVYEENKSNQRADVFQRRSRFDDREQQLPDSFGALEEPEQPAQPEYTDDTEKSGGYGEFLFRQGHDDDWMKSIQIKICAIYYISKNCHGQNL